MSLTLPIPIAMREEMSNDPFYKKCCVADSECGGRIEWNHALIYAGKRQNEKFCILPMCHWHHYHEARRDIKKKINTLLLKRATPEDLAKYPKRDFTIL